MHITAKGDPDSWHDWAVKTGIHRFVISYLEYNPTALMRSDSPESSLAFPTPRSWEMVSNILTNISENTDAIQPLISGCIGTSVTYNFLKWCSLFSSLPSVGDIFAGKRAAVEKSPEMQEALRAEMVAYARQHPEKELINNSIAFAVGLPWTFRTNLLHDYQLIPTLRPILSENEIYLDAVKAGLK